MRLLDRAAESPGTAVLARSRLDPQPLGFRVASGELPRALPLGRGVQHALRVGGIQRSILAHRKSGASHDTGHHPSVFDPSERDRILLATQEPLGAVDRIKRPVGVGGPVVVARIDGREHLLLLDAVAPVLDHFHDGPSHDGGFLVGQPQGILFAHDPMVRRVLEHVLQGQGHDRLGCVVGHRDGAPVVLGQGGDLLQAFLDGTGDLAGDGDGLHGGVKLIRWGIHDPSSSARSPVMLPMKTPRRGPAGRRGDLR